MVNIPVNVSTFPTDEIGVVTDINQNINQEYYEWLLKQHNYFPDCAFHKVSAIKFVSIVFCYMISRYNCYCVLLFLLYFNTYMQAHTRHAYGAVKYNDTSKAFLRC